MTPEEILFVYKHLGAYGLAVLSVAVIAFVVGKHGLGAYLSEKGKNLATREDVEHITRLVESAKAPYTELLEELRARHQLRLAAVDRRLQAHQEAFVLWRDLVRVVHKEGVGKAVVDCELWWERNCLYLEPEVRESFVRAYSAANIHRSLLGDRSDAEGVQANWREVMQFPDVLFRATRLPTLSELERKAVEGLTILKEEQQ